MSTAKSDTFVDDKKTQEQLEEELGHGVEKEPQLPPEPRLEIAKINLSDVFDVKSIVDEITKLPDIKNSVTQTNKYDQYQTVARKIWLIKQSEKDSYTMRMRVVESRDGKKLIWKRDSEGRIEVVPKTFYYTPITVQEKEEINNLLRDKQSIEYDVALEGQKLVKLTEKYEDEPDREEFTKKTWVELSHQFFVSNQTYYIQAFKAYFGGSDEIIERLFFEDIINYVDVAVYKEGVKSPQ